MKRIIWTVALLAAQPAMANDKQDFSDCDGRIHPGKQDDGMRGEASVSRFSQLESMFGGVAPLLPSQSDGRIEACTRALASPRLLPGQTLRRAHLLRARAAAQIEAGHQAEALSDLDQAAAATTDRQADPFFERSMGASLKLMRAIVLVEQGDKTSARPLVEQALAVRPYALGLQVIGTQLLQDLAPADESQAARWNQVIKLDARSALQAAIVSADAGRFADALHFNSMQPAPVTTPPSGTTAQPPVAIDLGSLKTRPRIAYAMAATGDLSGAKVQLEMLKTSLGMSGTEANPANAIGQQVDRMLGGLFERTSRLVGARIALAEGRKADALALFDKQPPLPKDAMTLDLISQLNAGLPATDPARISDQPVRASIAADSDNNLRRLASKVLFAPETPRSVVDYSKSRPNILSALVGGALSFGTTLLGGIERTDGFRSTPQPDGTVKVEFIGNTPSESMVQEMTLLRAAELTRAAGKWGFVIKGRADYTRYLVSSQYGAEISRVPTGHKTELVVRYVDEGADKDRALGAVEVIDALGPFYYEDKAKK